MLSQSVHTLSPWCPDISYASPSPATGPWPLSDLPRRGQSQTLDQDVRTLCILYATTQENKKNPQSPHKPRALQFWLRSFNRLWPWPTFDYPHASRPLTPFYSLRRYARKRKKTLDYPRRVWPCNFCYAPPVDSGLGLPSIAHQHPSRYNTTTQENKKNPGQADKAQPLSKTQAL